MLCTYKRRSLLFIIFEPLFILNQTTVNPKRHPSTLKEKELYKSDASISYSDLISSILLATISILLIVWGLEIKDLLTNSLIAIVVIGSEIAWFLEHQHYSIFHSDKIMVYYPSYKPKNYSILLSEIDTITYFNASRGTSHIVVYSTKRNRTIKHKITLGNDYNYKSAPLLRHFQNNDINVIAKQDDHELTLFLEGIIDELPMTNDTKINSRENKGKSSQKIWFK